MNAPTTSAQLDELITALSGSPSEIPTRYLYDDRGSELFAQITTLEEYYPTRTETRILQAHAGDVVREVQPRHLAELGSGVGTKIRTLLDAMKAEGLMTSCAFFEINEAFLEASADKLRELYPGLEVRAIQGNFLTDLEALGPGGERLILFLAGTIGNLKVAAVPGFLSNVAAQMLPGDGFLVGIDLVKDPRILEAAYNDARGVTAEFNLNILRVLEKRFAAEVDVDAFVHRAVFDPLSSWIEMRLIAQRKTTIAVGGFERTYESGEWIRTEVSCKYTREAFEAVLESTPLGIRSWYTDDKAWFADVLLERRR